MNDTVAQDGAKVHDDLTLQLVERAQRIDATLLPADVREIARQCVLDWIGVALGGSDDHLTHILLDEALAEGGKPAAAPSAPTVHVE